MRILLYVAVPLLVLAWVAALAVALSSSNCFDTAVMAWIVLVVTPVAAALVHIGVEEWDLRIERKKHGKK
jgi:hypothetical protein